ncbi:MAG TPA: ribbon-helix-helix protein, CopG family [Candidatus Elarobacter sp.]|nr:ribbon-helix-helix protein, CopG family [Candidatus Elarobacter sp.]
MRAEPNPNPPISIRLSAPLIERLDRLAAREHRKRSNLIQHILWEYVHANDV